jgi:hypothetical protein
MGAWRRLYSVAAPEARVARHEPLGVTRGAGLPEALGRRSGSDEHEPEAAGARVHHHERGAEDRFQPRLSSLAQPRSR